MTSLEKYAESFRDLKKEFQTRKEILKGILKND